MVTTPLIQNGIKVELPKGHVSDVDLAEKPQESVVALDAQGIIYLNNQAGTATDILQQLHYASEHKGVDAVIVRADTGVQFGKVIELVDAIKNIGKITYVAFTTEKISTSGAR